MHNLRDQLRDSYARHPRFQFEAPAWELESALLDDFDDTYEYLERYGASMSAAAYTHARQRNLEQLHRIFEAAQHQALDDMERRFLSELEVECVRLANTELAHHRATRRPAPGLIAAVDGVQSKALQLTRDRHFFGTLPPSAVAEMLSIGAADIRTFRQRAEAGRLKRDDLSVNEGPVIKRIVSVLNREFERQGVLAAVSAYAGERVRVTGAALELSVPQATWWANAFDDLLRAPRSLYAHLDESIDVPKAIVYLSDVGPTHGPTSCYPKAFESMALRPLAKLIGRTVGAVGNDAGSPLKAYYAKQYHQSMSSEPFRKHFMRLPSAVRFNSHLGWDVLPESAVEHALVDSELVMTGPAGTCIVFDGARLLHRGGMVQERDRLALQVIFSNSTLSRRAVNKIKRVLA